MREQALVRIYSKRQFNKALPRSPASASAQIHAIRTLIRPKPET
jgi:hypothetical protein